MTQDTYEPQYLGRILYSSDRLLEGQGMQILVGKADSKVCIAKVKLNQAFLDRQCNNLPELVSKWIVSMFWCWKATTE